MKNAKLNKEFVDQYKPVFTDQLIQRAFERKNILNGKDILHITPIKQLNLFIIKVLFTRWQDEMKNLESPYFDYKSSEVRKSMVEFMNVLSQNIQISAEDIRPLVYDALEETCQIAISPSEYIYSELQKKNVKTLNPKIQKQLVKYVALHKSEINEYLQSAIGSGPNDVIQNFPLFDVDQNAEDLAAMLSEVLVVNKSDLIMQEVHTPEIEEEPMVEEEVEAPVQSSEEMEAPVESISQQEEMVEQEPDGGEGDVTEEVENQGEESETTAPTLNDKFELEAKTLADLHEEKGIESIIDGISINHKYMFLQELFEGDNDSFNSAVEEVEQCSSFDEAVELLVQTYAKKYEWDMNSDEVKELLKVIFRRFR